MAREGERGKRGSATQGASAAGPPRFPALRERAYLIPALVAVLAFSLWQGASLFAWYLEHARLPEWDMAGHGLQGYELAADLHSGRILVFLRHLAAQDSWPFGFSLLLAPFLLAGQAAGASGFASATLLSSVCFALVPPILLWVGREADEGPAGCWAGLLAAALFLTSPLHRLYSVLVMREEAGALAALLAFGLYLRARRLGSLGAWRAAGLATLMLLFIKYNYGFVWLATLAVLEAWRLRGCWSKGLAGLRGEGSIGARPRWWVPLAAAYLAAVLVILAGWGDLAGSVLYPGLIAATLGALWAVGRRPGSFRAWWNDLPPERRAALETVVLPFWAWNLLHDHTRSILASLLGRRTSGLAFWSAESLLFYPKALAREYAASPLVGTVIVLAVLASLLPGFRGGPGRALRGAALLGLALVAVHPHKQERFLAVVAPFLMLLGALSFARLAHALPGRRGSSAGGLACAAAVAALLLPLEGSRLPAMLAEGYRQESMDPLLEPCLEWFRAEADRSRRTAVAGSFNEFSANLVFWALRQGPPPADLPEAPLMDPPAGGARLSAAEAREWVRRRGPEQVLAIRLLPESPWYGSGDFVRWNAWQLALIDALEADPAWEKKAGKLFRPPGVEVSVLRHAGPRSR